jgi:acyl-CoA synthetase (AMP-forming)/AMP-acid ligase II
MELTEKTKENIHKAHFVRGISPAEYMVKYRNIFELIQYRSRLQPDDIFIVFYPDSGDKPQLTYNDFADKVFRTANLLKAKGIKPGDRIATVSSNHINTVIQYFAAWCMGATVVPINVNEEPERIKYILESSNTKLAFVKHEYLDKILSYKNDLPDLKQIIIHASAGGEIPEEFVIYEKEITKQESSFEPDESVNQETEALIVYTSGTTGLPKGVVLTQYNLMVDADGISKWHKIEKGQTMMCVLPIHHVNGTIVTIVTPMYYGGRLILNQKFHTDKFFTRLAEENVQIVSVVPTLLQFLCHDFEGKASVIPQLTSFRHIICGAGPLTCELAAKFENMFGLRIAHGYGLSETTCYSCFIPVDLPAAEHKRWLHDYGFPSIGIEIEPNEMDIHNDKGESLNENERGEIVIRGHNVMKYYDGNAEANDKTFEFGWFRSGDEGFYINDKEGGKKYFFITGRIKELIIRGGINIAPLEIDEVLMSLPQVNTGIAVGFDNDWYGEEVGALVLLKEGYAESDELKSEIIALCVKKLPYYKTPKVVIFTDTIPVTSTGKYQRNKVKHLFAEYKSVQFRE